MNPRTARWLAWALAGLYVALIGVGLALQVVTDSYLGGVPLWTMLLEASILTLVTGVGALLVARRPRNPVGWLWCLLALAAASDQFAWGYASFGYTAHPGSLPGAEAAIVWLYWLGRGTLGNVVITLLLLVFPTGRPLSPRWGIFAWIVSGATLVLIPVSAVAPKPFIYFPFPTDILAAGDLARAILDPLRVLAYLAAVLCIVAATLSTFIRLARARGIERQQVKWFVFAIAFMAPGQFLVWWGSIWQAPGPNWPFLLGISIVLCSLTGIVVASAVAILKYHLYAIDIIINRTLVYGTLTGVLAVLYFAGVALLGAVVQTLTGQRSQIAIVFPTLVIAALISPLRRRIQDAIDRRFYRRKYDAAQTLAAFAATVRDEVDLDRLSAELLRTVNETMQLRYVSLWLREPEGVAPYK